MINELKFDKLGLIPCIIQDFDSGEILMLAYMNCQSLNMTIETGYTHFWSRSRQKFWKKGETSGHVQEVKEILIDCDADTIVIKAIQHGPGACHAGYKSCFYRNINGNIIADKTFSEDDVYKK
jgi:phosphoribosyl-AMP cyclohydrolase